MRMFIQSLLDIFLNYVMSCFEIQIMTSIVNIGIYNHVLRSEGVMIMHVEL